MDEKGLVGRAHFMLFVAALIYSGYNVLLAEALETKVSATGLSLFREIVAVPLLYAWAWRAEHPLVVPSERRFLVLGCILGAFQLCFAVGVSLTDASTAAILQCVEPSTAAVLGALVGAEPCTRTKVASALLAGAGVVVLQINAGHVRATGSAATRAIGCALLFCQGLGIACYCLVQKSLVAWHGPITVTAHAYLVSLGIMTCAAGVSTVFELETPEPLSRQGVDALVQTKSLLVVAYSAVLSSVVGYTLRAAANKTVDASTLVLYNAVQPPLTALLAFLLAPNTARFGLSEVLATLLVAAAVGLRAADRRHSGVAVRDGDLLLAVSSNSPRRV